MLAKKSPGLRRRAFFRTHTRQQLEECPPRTQNGVQELDIPILDNLSGVMQALGLTLDDALGFQPGSGWPAGDDGNDTEGSALLVKSESADLDFKPRQNAQGRSSGRWGFAVDAHERLARYSPADLKAMPLGNPDARAHRAVHQLAGKYGINRQGTLLTVLSKILQELLCVKLVIRRSDGELPDGKKSKHAVRGLVLESVGESLVRRWLIWQTIEGEDAGAEGDIETAQRPRNVAVPAAELLQHRADREAQERRARSAAVGRDRRLLLRRCRRRRKPLCLRLEHSSLGHRQWLCWRRRSRSGGGCRRHGRPRPAV
jgi:hypothetical protein